MHSFRLNEHGNISDIRLIDMLLAVETKKAKSEANNLLEEQIFEFANKVFQGNRKFHHAFDHSMSAPELIPNEEDVKQKTRKYDVQVDVWSLGCVAFNLFTGVPPYFESSNLALFKRIRAGEWRRNAPESTYFMPDDGEDLSEKHFKQATYSLIEFFDQVFQVDPKKRINTQKLVQDKFVKSQQDRFAKLSKTKVTEMFNNLRTFRTVPGF